jgi:hypothetical protein
LDWLVDEGGAKYAEMIIVLKDAGFKHLWETELLPVLKKSIAAQEEYHSKLDYKGLLSDICIPKQCAPIETVRIYVSALSYPVAFKLYDSSFLVNISDWGMEMVAHELMHGFATEEVIDMYQKYVEGDDYLKKQHDRLINDLRSGDEEEFVSAAEYYLRMKHGGESKSTLLEYAKRQYGGCMPNRYSCSTFFQKNGKHRKTITNGLKMRLHQGNCQRPTLSTVSRNHPIKGLFILKTGAASLSYM